MKKITALLLLVFSVHAGAAGKLEGVQLSATADTKRLVLNLSHSPNYKVFSLTHPARVVIDLKDTRLAAALPRDLGSGPIRGLRSGIRHGRDLRVVIDLSAAAPFDSFVLQPSAGQGYRLVVDLGRSEAVPTVVAAPSPPPALTQTASPPVAVAHRPSESQARDVIVAIDAGHGGIDPGARGPNGVKEKDVVLAIARQLEHKLRNLPGIEPVLTRDGDYFVPLRKRVAKARASNADLMISIHADAIDVPSVRGSSVYVLSHRGASSEAARWLAEKENAADLVGGVTLDDKDDVLKSVLLDLSQTATIEASTKAAKEVLHALHGVGRLHRRQVEHAGFVVLKAPDIPSMLIETAFISNPREERNLRSPAYQRRLAAAIATGVREYFQENAPPGTKLALANATRRHVIAKGDTLSGIANRYGVSVDTLRISNNLNNDRLYIGNVLRIPPSNGT